MGGRCGVNETQKELWQGGNNVISLDFSIIQSLPHHDLCVRKELSRGSDTILNVVCMLKVRRVHCQM